MDDLHRRFLGAAYKLGIDRPAHQVALDEIANELDLEPSVFPYRDRLSTAAQYLGTKGLIEKRTTAYEIFSLTREGIEEAERAADPVTQRREVRSRLLRTVYELADANPSRFVHWRNLAPRIGLDADNREHQKQAKAVAEHLRSSGLVVIEGDRGTAYKITAKGVDRVEGNEPAQQPANVSNTFNLSGNFYNAVIGTHNTAELTASFDFRSIERRIEAEGGEDKEELREALEELRVLLEECGTLDRGALSRFSSSMEKHSWFTGSVTQALLGFATQLAV